LVDATVKLSTLNRVKALLWLTIALLGSESVRAVSTNAWQRTDTYIAPNFNGFFPDDPAGAAWLDDLERNRTLERLTPEELILAVQKGLRRSTSPRLSILRTFGNRLIWGQKIQNPEAIELMYHAAGAGKNSDLTDHWAVYFGLSVVETKSPNILRTLAELCMQSDQADMLSRVAWGVRTQQSDCLAYLQPFLNSNEESVRAQARIVSRIIKGELNAFEWATEETRKKAEINYRGELPTIKRLLTDGSSKQRLEVLEKIQKNGIALIMDDSFIPAFATCARDVDARARNEVTVVAGYNWVWSAKKQNPDAMDLMLQLSYDPDPHVRYNSVYYGLSTIQNKSDAVLRRLIEMLFKDGDNSDIAGRISWGLTFGRRSVPEPVPAIVAGYLNDPNPRVANLAAQWYQSHLESALPEGDKSGAQQLRTNPVAEIRTRLHSGFRPFILRLSDGHR
jgi:hypothetical protein